MTDAFDRLKAALSDRYTIEREIGRGGMATVYLAHDLKHDRKVAVKVLRPELAAALGAERFHQEIKIAAQLTHPHILPLHDSGDADGFLYYVMPYIEGESLRDKLAHEGELPIAEAVRIIRDVVEALSDAHEHGVVHRDIKPDNVLLTKHHALVTDFGVAKAVSDATARQQLTTEGVALGTPTYMSPEQAAADPHIDHRADIYAVGVVAYELLTGRPPFLGTTPQMILSAHLADCPEPVTKYREAVPPALEQLVMKCLEKKAADRWQSAEELLPHLEALVTPSGGTTPVGTVPVAAARRGWKVAVAAGVVAAILAVILVVTNLPHGSGVTLDPERVLVAVFDNQTGDPELDLVGVMAGNWITQGLQMSGVVQVVPWLEAQQASRYVAAALDSGNVRNPVLALAEETGAAIVVYGSYYRRGDSVLYHVEVTDALRGRTLGSLAPEAAPLDAPEEALAPLRQRVMGFLAISFDERIASQASNVAQPPSFEAYRAFDEGVAHYLRLEYPPALSYLSQAYELDTTFTTALIYATLIRNNRHEWALSDSLVRLLERYRGRLSEYDRNWVDYLKARVDGDNPAALQAIRRAAELAPGSKAVYNRAFFALMYSNRPQEAVDALLTLDPERGPMRGWIVYHTALFNSYLKLHEHEKALEVARRARGIFENNPVVLLWEGLAMVGLGRIDEIDGVLDEITAWPDEGDEGPWQEGYFASLAGWLRLNGHYDAAQRVVARGIEWCESRSTQTKSSADYRVEYAWVLYVANRRDDGYNVAKSLSEAFPGNLEYRGLVGVFAASRGDENEALEISRWLGALNRPYLKGDNTWWQSLIAGELGDGENAVGFLKQAFSDGFRQPSPYEYVLLAFESLHDYAPFQEFMRPKG